MYKALEQIGAEVVWVQVKRTWVYNIVAVIYKFLSILTKTRILKEYTIVEAILASKSLDRKLIVCTFLFCNYIFIGNKEAYNLPFWRNFRTYGWLLF